MTLLLWLAGVVFAAGLGAVWWRRDWSPFRPPLAMLIGAFVLPVATWVVAAGSCGR